MFLPLPRKPRGVVCVLGAGEFSVPPPRQLVLPLHLQGQRVRGWALGWSPGAAAPLCPGTEGLQPPASGWELLFHLGSRLRDMLAHTSLGNLPSHLSVWSCLLLELRVLWPLLEGLLPL